MMHTLVEMFHCGAAQPKRTGIRSVRLYRVRDLNEYGNLLLPPRVRSFGKASDNLSVVCCDIFPEGMQ